MTYRTMTPYGWPQIVLYCTGKDLGQAEVVKAYGSCHVPIQPGTHKKVIRMFAPIKPSPFKEFFGVFGQGGGEFID